VGAITARSGSQPRSGEGARISWTYQPNGARSAETRDAPGRLVGGDGGIGGHRPDAIAGLQDRRPGRQFGQDFMTEVGAAAGLRHRVVLCEGAETSCALVAIDAATGRLHCSPVSRKATAAHLIDVNWRQ
jgi:hypothetical protein